MISPRLFVTLKLLTAQQTTARACFSLTSINNFRMGDVKGMIEGKIAGKKVMVFSKSYCPFCTKAKKVFDRLIKEGKLSTDDYEVLEIENLPNCDAIQNELKKKTGASSVPRVFISGNSIGGGDDVVRADSSGALIKLIENK